MLNVLAASEILVQSQCSDRSDSPQNLFYLILQLSSL